MSDAMLPAHGGFKNLRTFQIARLVYDGTAIFCERFIDKRSRTHDQMVQAARSGTQNIAEGSLASATSKEMEIKLTNVARASLGELLLDYEDFLRQRRLPLWDKNSPQALAVRQAYRSSDKSDRSDSSDPHGWRTASAETLANTLICLINQASALLRNQIRRLEQDFLEHGGLRERMTRARLESRAKQHAQPQEPQAPQCPQCGKAMRLRTARVGRHAGRSFWGCTGYPDCRGIREVDG
jgi:four helix bundle suffix protein